MESDSDRLAILEALGELVTVNDCEISAIFESAYIGAGVGGEFVESASPALICRTADVVSVSQKDTAIAGNKNYTVESVQPDGDGMTTLILRAA